MYVVAAPDVLTSAAGDLAAIGSAVSAANATASNATTSLLTAAADEVSTRIAALFGAYGLEYQAAAAQVAQFGERAVLELAANANAYLTAEMLKRGRNSGERAHRAGPDAVVARTGR